MFEGKDFRTGYVSIASGGQQGSRRKRPAESRDGDDNGSLTGGEGSRMKRRRVGEIVQNSKRMKLKDNEEVENQRG